MPEPRQHAPAAGRRMHVTERIVITPQRRGSDRPAPLEIRFHPRVPTPPDDDAPSATVNGHVESRPPVPPPPGGAQR